MNEQLFKSLLNSIVNFYCNIFGYNRILLKKFSKMPLINIYEGSIMIIHSK